MSATASGGGSATAPAAGMKGWLVILLAGCGLLLVAIGLIDPTYPERAYSDPLGFVDMPFAMLASAGSAVRLVIELLWIASAVLTAGIAVTIARAGFGTSAHGALALTTAATAFSIGYFLFFAAGNPNGLYDALLPTGAPRLLGDAIASGVFAAALLAWLRFCALFPGSLQEVDLRRYATSEDKAGGLAPLRRPHSWWKRANRARKGDVSLAVRMVRALQHEYSPSVAFLVGAALAVGLVLLWPTDPMLARFSVFANAMWATFIGGYLLLRVQLFAGDEDARWRLAWIFGGMLTACWVLVLCGVVAFALAPLLGEVGYWAYLLGIFVVGPVLGVLSVIGGVTVAVFYMGAVDGSLVLRRTTVYGVLGVLITTLFVALEGALSTYIVGRVGLPESVSTIAAGSGIAMAFGSLRNRAEIITNRGVDRLLGVRSITEGRSMHAAILISDLAGYTALSRESPSDALTLAAVLHTTARRNVEHAGGRLVKTMGDAILAVFADAADAVHCASVLHERFATAVTALDLRDARLRSGIHSGSVVVDRRGDVFGDVVNITSRLQSAADPGSIFVSVAAMPPLELPTGWRSESLPPLTLRGVEGATAAIRLVQAESWSSPGGLDRSTQHSG